MLSSFEEIIADAKPVSNQEELQAKRDTCDELQHSYRIRALTALGFGATECAVGFASLANRGNPNAGELLAIMAAHTLCIFMTAGSVRAMQRTRERLSRILKTIEDFEDKERSNQKT